MSIERKNVLAAQNAWADGIVAIGKVFLEKGDYKARAKEHIDTLYAYGVTPVLFKPTLASAVPFRGSFDDALSYFVGGHIEEDKGFAIKPWEKVRYDQRQILTFDTHALSMGRYYFTPHGEKSEQMVEFTFGYIKDKSGRLRINLHHSSLPYQAA